MDLGERLKMKRIETLGAICGIVILESIALMKGIDGTILTMVIGVLAGLGGYYIRGWKENGILYRTEKSDS